MIRRLQLLKIAPAAALLAMILPVSADIQVTDWKAPGDGLLLWDTATNLQWLNLKQTQGQSFNQVSSLLATTYAGFSYATTSDMWTFFADAGLSPFYPAPAAATASLASLWGVTVPQFFFAAGITSSDNQFAPGNKLVAGVGWANQDGTEWFANATASNALPDEANPGFGSALFRPYQTLAVPEASLPAMLTLGIAVLALVGRRRRAP